MSNLMKLALKVEKHLKKLAEESSAEEAARSFSKQATHSAVTQLNELVQAASALFKYKSKIDKALASDEFYGEMAMKSLHGLVESIYFAASGMKSDALKKGLSQSDMAARKKRIVGMCSQLAGLLQSHGVGYETIQSLGVNLVKAKAEALVPVNLPALQPTQAPAAKPADVDGISNVRPEYESVEEVQKWYAPTPEDLERAKMKKAPTSEQLSEVVRDLGKKSPFQETSTEVDWTDSGKAKW